MLYQRDGDQTKGNETYPSKNPVPFVATVARIDILMILESRTLPKRIAPGAEAHQGHNFPRDR